MSTSGSSCESNSCILCESTAVSAYHSDKRRDYFKCSMCHLVFVPLHQHLSCDDEKAEYDKHENNVSDVGYLRFLSRVGKPLLAALGKLEKAEEFGSVSNDKLLIKPAHKSNANLSGLDFGCGPGPALATELNRLGIDTDVYDIYYYPNSDKLNKKYDFVTCTEVVEHFNQPKASLPILLQLIKPGGIIAIMTKLVIDQDRFAHWHYKNDQTHVSFYSKETFEWIAQQFGFSVEFVDKDVIFLHKQ
ncbi:class I SAM-dependent methyltransferase [Psychrosphaera ytuae]|uniref:Class I SAM-dependent methyltransferase n=1 Tax=Psychrosphaera ytuae TaxID=2820710 RepID=A0A975DCX2_9GAMM|nr:class I SAM-dependent methyltransferase [Psychrosphaera ytuae]QTH64847.1 class I SAM-dependent methyltransferase [Psychrosphaera ytuae]